MRAFWLHGSTLPNQFLYIRLSPSIIPKPECLWQWVAIDVPGGNDPMATNERTNLAKAWESVTDSPLPGEDCPEIPREIEDSTYTLNCKPYEGQTFRLYNPQKSGGWIDIEASETVDIEE